MSLVRALPWYTYTSVCKNCGLEICIESDRTLFLDDPRPWVHRWPKLCEDADPGKEADVILTKDTKHPHWGGVSADSPPKQRAIQYQMKYGMSYRQAEAIVAEEIKQDGFKWDHPLKAMNK